MQIKKLVVRDTNSYILYDENSLEALIIDPGFESKKFINFIESNNLNLKEIVLTHYHYDHICAVLDLKEKYNAIVSIHKNDVAGLKNPAINLSKKGLKKPISIVADKSLLDKDLIEINNISLKVIHTPGHTEGSICLKLKGENIIFTGDTLFTDGVGRWDLVGGSEKKMVHSIKNKVYNWNDNLMVYCGHGNDDLLSNIKKNNEEYLYILKHY